MDEKEIQEVENEIETVTGGMPSDFDIFAGTDPGDAQERRLARNERHDSDDIAPAPDPIGNYTGPRHGSEVKNFEELRAHAEYREALAKEKYPDYQECVDRYLIPRLPEIEPEKLREFFLRDDCAELAYRAAKQLEQQYRSQAPSLEEVEKMTGDEFSASLDQWMRTARARDDDDEKRSFVTKSEMKALEKLQPEDFARALDILKSR
jgi:hypothetical protein